MRRRVDLKLTAYARELRNNPTDTERAVWRLISRYRPAFTRQLVIAPYIVDLACRQARLAIEFDGGHHAEQIVKDSHRTARIEAQGWRLIRLWNSDVLENTEGAVQHILLQAAECLGGTHPQPLPSREGRIRLPRTRT